jgi:hypothetical protein
MTSDRNKAGAHAEIKRRYANRGEGGKGGGNLRRGELRRLARHRGVHEYEVDAWIADEIGNPFDWSAESLGRAVRLTFAEQIMLVIKTFHCFDRPVADVRAHYAAKRKERDRMDKQQQRERAGRRGPALSARAQAVLDVVAGDWTAASTVIDRAATMEAFGKLKAGPTMRKVVHRAIGELHDAGQIEVDLRDGRNGFPTRFLRRSV